MYAGLSEWRRRRCGRPLWGDLSRRRWPLVVLAVAAVLFFVLRNVPVYPFRLLAPPGLIGRNPRKFSLPRTPHLCYFGENLKGGPHAD